MEQVEALLRTPAEFEHRLMVKLMIYLGLRIGECVHLNASWLQEGNIRIPMFQKCDHAECEYEWHPKSKASIRVLPVPGDMQEDLYTFLGHHPNGFGLTRQAAYTVVKRMCKQAGIKVKGLSGDTIYPHVLRSTCATILATRRMSAVGLCYIMGWSSIDMGQHYINIAQAKKEAHKQFKEIMG